MRGIDVVQHMPEASNETILRVKNLRAYYTSAQGLVKAVNDVSFDIKKGEAVGLFGESGSGKTSVALAIMGIFDRVSRFYASASSDPENRRLWELKDAAKKKGLSREEVGSELPGVSGEIWYKGQNILALDEDEYRKIRGNEITYVPQGTHKSLNPYTQIADQTGEPLWVHDEDKIMTERFVARRVLETLDLVEIADTDLRQLMKPSQFSMGEDQRILMAMALITNPVLLIADEPTTAVDVGVQHRILRAIQLVREELHLSMLLISNDQGLIAETSDRVAVMSSGRIMEFGDVKRVLLSPGHPFTRAFVMSNPSMEIIRKIREKGMRIRGIPGEPPDLSRPPPGCPFHTRCEFAKEICRMEVPEYREIEENYWIFCHRYEELPEW